VRIDHQFTPPGGLFCKHQTTPELICGYPRAVHTAVQISDEREQVITTIECCASEGASEALAERRQAAREAFCDEFLSPETIRSETYRGLEMCVETATRVQVTPDLLAAIEEQSNDGWPASADVQAIATAAFRAAGFEVVE
jgi:hypothetical protein